MYATIIVSEDTEQFFEEWREAEFLCFLLQKAVRVTTIMKRLRAPEQSDSRANSPAAGAAAPPSAANDPSHPPSSAALPEGATPALAEVPAGGEISQAPTEAAASAAEPQQLSPAAQEVEPATRCNGESSAAHCAATETGNEQG